MSAATVVVRLLGALALVVPAGLVGVAGPAAADSTVQAPVQLQLPGEAPRLTGTDPGAPTELPAGWSRTPLPGDDNASRYFSYTRTVEDSSVAFAAVGPGADADGAEAFRIEVSTTSGTSCGSQFGSRPEGERGLVTATVRTGAVLEEEESDSDTECREASTLRLTLSRGTSSEVTGDSEVWFRVVEEAPLASRTGLAPAEDRARTAAVDVGGEARERNGSADVASAPTVGTGIWRGSVEADGQVAYRVRLDYGQTLYAEAVSPALEGDLADEVGYDARLQVVVRDPLMSAGLTQSIDDSLGSDPAAARAAAGPVQYANRYEVSPAPSVPGEYLVVVAVTVDPDSTAELGDVPFTLRLRVDGEPGEAPDHASTPPFVTAEGRAASVPLGLPPGEEEGTSWGRYAGGGGLVLGGLVALGAGLVLLRRRPAR